MTFLLHMDEDLPEESYNLGILLKLYDKLSKNLIFSGVNPGVFQGLEGKMSYKMAKNEKLYDNSLKTNLIFILHVI